MAEIAVSLAAKEAEGLVDKLVNKLYTTVSGELSLLLGVRGEIQFIRDELQVMSEFLQGAEEKQSTDRAAKAWAKQMKALAHAAEDCIDEFSLHLTRHHSTNLATALWHRVRSISKLGARHRIAAQIRSIKLKVEEASQRRLRYEITHKASTSADVDVHGSLYDPRSAALFVDDSQLVGIDEPRGKLVQWLLDGNKPRLSLMVVVGAGGSGKTTVARKAFESLDITSGHFFCRVWITVSQVYSIPVLLRDMIRQLFSSPPQDLDNIEKTTLIQKLRDHMKDRRYVVIFDDIWKINAWNSLQDALPENNLGSRIIITTRDSEVANSCLAGHIPGFIYKHELLSEEQSKELFYKRMSLDQDTCPESFKNLSQNIVRKCDGLPLAIVSIAAALASKPKNRIKEWEAMINRLGSELESNPNLQNVTQVLNFSYADIPYHVKQCFLYLSKFPEDTLIESKRIKRLWIAEGIINARRGMCLEEVAESYLNELVSRHMVIPSVFSAATGKVKSFKIHDVMLEMIISKSMEENFLTLVQHDGIWTQQETIRRLITKKFPKTMHYTQRSKAILSQKQHIPEGIDVSHVRSLTIFGSYGQAFFSPRMGLLRVLDLEGYNGLSDRHLEVFCRLLHLKYLSLKDARIVVLPSRMGNLCNLETLDIRGCYIETIPGLTKLKRLRFLRCRSRSRNAGAGGLIGLPSGIGRLRSLEELSCVVIHEDRVGTLKGLEELTQLRKLGVSVTNSSGRRNDYSNVRFPLENLSGSLRSLRIDSVIGLSFPDDLEPPPSQLESLELIGRLPGCRIGSAPSRTWPDSLLVGLK